MTRIKVKQNIEFKGKKIDFLEFVKLTFKTICPDDEFQDNWHIEYLSKVFESTRLGVSDKKRILVNIPPRSLKSIVISIAWPAWILGHNPSQKIICASYSQHLANKLSSDCRTVMQSQWYKDMFPNTRIARGNNAKSKFMTTEQGFRFATSVTGSLTGEGADYLIVDDPITPLNSMSINSREQVNEWFDQTLISRLNNKKKGVIIVIMQRLHQKDLSGHLENKGTVWEHIKIPAIAEEDLVYKIGSNKYTFKKDTALHEERDSLEDWKKLKAEMGSKAFNCQYQQNPIAASNQLIRLKWFRRYNPINELPQGRYVQSWDCSFKVGDNADYSVCTTWLSSKNCMYLVDVFRDKLNFPDLKQKTIDLAEKYNPYSIIIEDKAAGHSLIQQLEYESCLPIIPFRPKQDKMTRFVTITPLIEGGRVYLPRDADWLAQYEMEIMNFPYSKHDDQVDSTSQFLRWIKNQNFCPARIKLL